MSLYLQATSEGGEQVAKSCFIPRLRAITEVKSVPAPSLHFSLYSNFPYFIISIFLPRTITRTCGWDQVSSTYPKGNTVDLLLIIQHLWPSCSREIICSDLIFPVCNKQHYPYCNHFMPYSHPNKCKYFVLN